MTEVRKHNVSSTPLSFFFVFLVKKQLSLCKLNYQEKHKTIKIFFSNTYSDDFIPLHKNPAINKFICLQGRAAHTPPVQLKKSMKAFLVLLFLVVPSGKMFSMFA